MGLVCIVRQTEYLIIFLLLVLQPSQTHLNPEDAQQNPVPSFLYVQDSCMCKIKNASCLIVELLLLQSS